MKNDIERFDFTFFIIGILLGGTIGIGTIFSITTLGLFISLSKKIIVFVKS